jgi:hypothetical protein
MYCYIVDQFVTKAVARQLANRVIYSILWYCKDYYTEEWNNLVQLFSYGL